MRISSVLIYGLAGVGTAAAAVAAVQGNAQFVARAEPTYDPATDIIFDPKVEVAILDVASELINRESATRRRQVTEAPTVTDADVEKAIRQMADKMPEGKKEAALARLSSPEGKQFVKAMLIYFADGAKTGKKPVSYYLPTEVC